MNEVLLNQVGGIVRAVVPVLVSIMVTKGFLPEEIAGPFTESAVVCLTVLIVALWSLRTNKLAAVVKQAASETGVSVVVFPHAPAEVKAVAADPKQPDVLPAA